MCRSEVALLRQKIESEIVSMRYGLQGIALGTARHAFIHARLERLGGYQDRLAHHIGIEAAHEEVGLLYMQTMENGSSEAVL